MLSTLREKYFTLRIVDTLSKIVENFTTTSITVSIVFPKLNIFTNENFY